MPATQQTASAYPGWSLQLVVARRASLVSAPGAQGAAGRASLAIRSDLELSTLRAAHPNIPM